MLLLSLYLCKNKHISAPDFNLMSICVNFCVLNTGTIFEKIDSYISVPVRRQMWRGKNLGNVITQEQWDAIDSGSFKDIFVGDYWYINGHKWRIMDIDYWYGTVGVRINPEHHVVIVPDEIIGNITSMNDTDTTDGAYTGSKMYQTGLKDTVDYIYNLFGKDHILVYKDLLTSSVSNGHPSNGGWYDCKVELMNEPMVYGSYIMSAGGDGSFISHRYTVSKTQLAGFKLSPVNIMTAGYQSYWLRDIVSSRNFAAVSSDGVANAYGATALSGVRPVFGIHG